MGIFPSYEMHECRKAKHTKLCKGGNVSQFRKYRSISLPRTVTHVPNWTYCL